MLLTAMKAVVIFQTPLIPLSGGGRRATRQEWIRMVRPEGRKEGKEGGRIVDREMPNVIYLSGRTITCMDISSASARESAAEWGVSVGAGGLPVDTPETTSLGGPEREK